MRRKVYGESKQLTCFICNDTATTENPQGIPVCRHHKEEYGDFKCMCGEWVDIKTGKFGAFGVCMNCGPVNMNKLMEINGYPLKSVEDL